MILPPCPLPGNRAGWLGHVGVYGNDEQSSTDEASGTGARSQRERSAFDEAYRGGMYEEPPRWFW
jgi:hypothetical protein